VIIGILENPSARKFLHPISVETYFKLGEQNLISDNTELIEGVIFQPEYWIFNLEESILEVFLQPENGNYKVKKIFQKQDTIYPEFYKNLGIFLGDFFL
jgi:predicted  nucleic acid-binding Zn ribbon protein